jgi:hypothetical protein
VCISDHDCTSPPSHVEEPPEEWHRKDDAPDGVCSKLRIECLYSAGRSHALEESQVAANGAARPIKDAVSQLMTAQVKGSTRVAPRTHAGRVVEREDLKFAQRAERGGDSERPDPPARGWFGE